MTGSLALDRHWWHISPMRFVSARQSATGGRDVGRLAVALALSLFCGLWLVVGPVGTGSAAKRDGGPAAFGAALDRIVESEGGPPGVSVLIQRGNRREYHRRGFANVTKQLRPTARMPMRIASVSKAFSGAIALRLVRQGKLSLDDTIGERLPGLLPRARNVTLRQALNHTAGLPDYIRDKRFLRRLLADPSQYMPPRRLLSFVRNTPLRFRPGTKYEYSDTDNVVVGLMAEAATGKSYNRLLRELIFRPLKLRQTSLPHTLAISEPFLHGYDVPESSRVDPTTVEDVSRVINPALAWASGGMVSTVIELNRFFRAFIGGRLGVRPAAHRGFVRGSSSPPGPGRNTAGLSIFRYRTPCGTVFGHTGSFPGYRMFAAASRDGRRSVVFAVNAQIVPGEGSQQVSKRIRRAQTLAVCRALR